MCNGISPEIPIQIYKPHVKGVEQYILRQIMNLHVFLAVQKIEIEISK